MSRSQIEVAANLVLAGVLAAVLVVVLVPASLLGESDGTVRSISEAESWVIHAALFAAVGFVAGLRLAASDPGRPSPARTFVTLLLIAGLAAATEIAQLGVDGRNATVGDWTADLVGAVLGLAAAKVLGPPLIGWLLRPRPA